MKQIILASRILTALASSIIILVICYLFGWELLEGYLKGNDIGFYLGVVEWFDRHFLSMPQWYPFAGGGVSLVQATQLGSYHLPVIVSKLSLLTLDQSLRVVEFSSIFLVGLELYFFVWYFFKNQTMAILAGIFFLLSQAVWSVVIDIGMLPQSASLIFVLPAFAFLELFFEKKRGFWLALTILSFGLAVFTHLITGALLIEGLLLYGVLRAFLLSQKRIFFTCLGNLFWVIVAITLGFSLFAFWFLPFLRYLSIASRNTVVTYAFEQIDYINLVHLFGFGQKMGGWENFFALPVAILAFLGIILGLVKGNRRIIIFGIISVIFLLYSALPGLVPGLVKMAMASFITGTYYRAFLLPMIIMPILAAWGCSSLAQIILSPLKKTIVARIFLPILTLTIALSAILIFAKAPSYYDTPCYRGLGPGISEVDYCHFWGKIIQIKKISLKGTPWDESTSALSQKLNLSERERVDISPNLGPIIMNWPRFSSSSVVGLYAVWAGINNIFTGYFGGAFYGKNQDFGTAEEVASLASWFGVDKVVLRSSVDPQERFTQDFWQKDLDLNQEGLIDMLVLANKNPSGLLILSSQPKILVLGKFKNRAYEQFFRLANAGAYPYGKAMFVEGKDSGQIDDYSLEELKKFEMILLYGYTYKDQKKAFDLLENYVKDGGRLFIETGWQYVSPDWQMTQTPEILPVRSLKWQEFKSWDLEGFSPPEYQGGGWGVSVGEGLKSWAQPVLESDDKTLVVQGNFGQGKVVWSGMNLIGHAFTYKNKIEYFFLETLIDSLLIDRLGEDKTTQVSFNRINPDKIEFIFSQPQQNSWLYWRENFYPDWQARLSNGEKLPIYRAGPNFMLIPLKTVDGGEKITLTLDKSTVYLLSRLTSLLMIVFLVILFINDKMFLSFSRKIFSSFRPGLNKWWEQEE